MRTVSLIAELDSLFRASSFPATLRVANGDENAIAFAMDASETDSAYTVKANLPGFTKEQIQIDIDGKAVKVTATPAVEVLANDSEHYLRKERYAGKFERQFTLSQDIDAEQVLAKLEHGVLTITLVKKVLPAAKKVTIQ